MNELNLRILNNYLSSIYKNKNLKEIEKLANEIRDIFNKSSKKKFKKQFWSQKDFFLITYADSIVKKNQKNFKTLNVFLNKYCKDFEFLHILPFFPSSSDDGFAVVDYKEIDNKNGDWEDIKKLSRNFKLMVDLVINHCSSSNNLFKNFLKNIEPGSDYFISSEKKHLRRRSI